jgi:UDP-N-acetylmuramoyl-tripeptide--D-alanyl-D-alanine ligase
MKVTIEPVKLTELSEMFGGKSVSFDADLDGAVSSVCTDSREASANSVFVAIRGENTDGHRYISKAVELGATAVVCDHVPENSPEGCLYVVTENTEKALMTGAAYARKKLKRLHSCAVTGSVGKTTAKEAIWSALSEAVNTYKIDGNFNSVIGMPIALMAMPVKTENAVFEMGMSGLNEISPMSKTLRPDVAVITNVGHSHLEFLKTRENILKAKLEITDGLSENGTLIINGDDEMLATVDYSVYPFRTVRASVCDKNAEYFADNIRVSDGFMVFDLVTESSRIEDVAIPGTGNHLVLSALFALAVADSFGLDLSVCSKGLGIFKNAAMRQNVTAVGEYTIIEDCYNAAPESMRSALDTLSVISKKKNGRSFAVLGEMRELGENSTALHASVGKAVAEKEIDFLVGVGEGGRFIVQGAVNAGMDERNTYLYTDPDDFDKIAELLHNSLRPDDVLLVKASRGLRTERIIEAFKGLIK